MVYLKFYFFHFHSFLLKKTKSIYRRFEWKYAMQIHFLYLVLDNGISFYHNVDKQFKEQFQSELLGSLLFAFQETSKVIFKSPICKIQLDHYSLLIRQFRIQNIPIYLIIGTNSNNMEILTQFGNQFINAFQSLLQFYRIDLTNNETNYQFKEKIDLLYNQLRESVMVLD